MLSAALAVMVSLGEAQAVDDLAQFERVQRRGQVSLVVGALAPPALVIGGAGVLLGLFNGEAGNNGDASAALALGGFTLMGAGAGGMLIAPPIMAASSVRGARLSGTDATLGYAAWGLWGATMLSGSFSTAQNSGIVSGLSIASYAGSLVVGGLQLSKNRRAADLDSGGLSMQLVPASNGLALTGTF